MYIVSVYNVLVQKYYPRWHDQRLKYSHIVPYTDFVLEGEDWFAGNIWTPNIYIENEVTSEVMSMNRDSVFLRIIRTGEVNYNYRVRTTVLCDIQLKRFPHDFQVNRANSSRIITIFCPALQHELRVLVIL